MKKGLITRENFEAAKNLTEDIVKIQNSFTTLIGTINESKRIDNERDKLHGVLQLKAKRMIQEQYALEQIFGLRWAALDQQTKVIDEGLRTGNDQLILTGLQEMTNVITTNPLADFDAFRQALGNNDDVLELDF